MRNLITTDFAVSLYSKNGTVNSNLSEITVTNDDILVFNITKYEPHFNYKNVINRIIFNTNNTFTNLTFKLVQIPTNTSSNYTNIKNQIENGTGNVYLGEHTVNVSDLENNEVILDISNLDEDASQTNIVRVAIILKSTNDNNYCVINGNSIICYSEEISINSLNAKVDVSDNSKFSVNLRSGALLYNDLIYTSMGDDYNYPITIGYNQTKQYDLKIPILQLPYGIGLTYNACIKNGKIAKPGVALLNDRYLESYDGTLKRFRILNDDEKQKEEVEEAEEQIEKELKKYFEETFDLNYETQIDVNSEIYLSRCDEDGSYMKESIIYINNSKQFHSVVIYDSNQNAYIYETYENVDDDCVLYLKQIVCNDGKTITFDSDVVTNLQHTPLPYEVINRIIGPDIDITHEDIDSYEKEDLKFVKTINFTKDFRKIEFDYCDNSKAYVSDENNTYIEYFSYKLIDYSNPNNEIVIKHVRLKFNIDNGYFYLSEYLDYINRDRYVFEYPEIGVEINTVKRYIKDLSIDDSNIVYEEDELDSLYKLVDSISFDINNKYTDVINNITNNVTRYIFDKHNNIKEVINNNKSHTSYQYEDDRLTKTTSRLLTYDDEVKNSYFDEDFTHWSRSLATIVDKGLKYIDVKKDSTISQNIIFSPSNTYFIRGKIKPVEKIQSHIVIEGGYYNSNSFTGIECVYNTNTTKTSWYEFTSNEIIIPENATNITASITVYANSNLEIEYLEVVNKTTNESILVNSDFSSNLVGWSVVGSEPTIVSDDVDDNFGKRVYIDNGGYLEQYITVIPGEKYIFRGMVKHDNLSVPSTSYAKIESSYYLSDESSGSLNNQKITDYKTVNLDAQNNGWFEFKSQELSIPLNAFNISTKVRIYAINSLYVRNLRVSLDNIERSNLITKGKFDDGLNSISTNTAYTTSRFIVSDSESFEVIDAEESYDMPKAYVKKILKIKGDKLNSINTKKVTRCVKKSGSKDDLITGTVLVNVNLSHSDSLKYFIRVYDTPTTYKTYYTQASKSILQYQLLSLTISAETDYINIVVGCEYRGSNDAYITCFELNKQDSTKVMSYDDLRKTTNINESYFVYDLNGKVKKYIDKEKGLVDMTFNENGQITKSEDFSGNKITYSYDVNTSKLIKEEYTIENVDSFIKQYGYNDRITTYTDYLNKQYITTKDYLNRVINEKSPNNHELSSFYNKYDKLTKLVSNINSKTYNELSYNNFSYYDDSYESYNCEDDNYKKLNSSNTGSVYEYDYFYPNVIKNIKVNGVIIESYTYTDNLMLDTKTDLFGTYKYLYNDNNNIEKVQYKKLVNGEYVGGYVNLYKILYDRFNRIMYFINFHDDKTLHYEYDALGNIIAVNEINAINGIHYEYDKNNNIKTKEYFENNENQKLSYKLLDGDHNSSKGKYISTLLDKYNCDLIYKDSIKYGVFGIKEINRVTETDQSTTPDLTINMTVMNFLENNHYLSYDLSTWNQFRYTTIKNGQEKYLKKLQDEFAYHKTFSIWFKPSLSRSFNLFKLYVNGDDSNVASLDVLENGFVTLKSGTNTIISSLNCINVDNWNYVSLHIDKDDAEDIVTYYLCVNGTVVSVLAPLTFSIIGLKKLNIGEEDNLDIRSTQLEIAFVTIDNYKHTTNSLLEVYNEGVKNFLADTSLSYSSTIYETSDHTYEYKTYVDGLGRAVKKEYLIDDVIILDKEYSYVITNSLDDKIYGKTNILQENLNITNNTSYNQTINYEYDDLQNIISRSEVGGRTYQYEYDKLGRLTEEVNNGVLYNYTYDENGNIKTKKKTINNVQSIDTFNYSTTYKDVLVSYKLASNNSNSYITNVNNFYPSSITTGTQVDNLTWEKGRLISFNDVTFEYNVNGIRTKKIVGTTQKVIHTYKLEGTKIIKEYIEDQINNKNIAFEYIYDEQDILVGVKVDDEVYYYDRNIMGEITGIIDSNGNYVVKYFYNAYGEVQVEPLSVTNISTYNSFLYKGYYYDFETELFYCKSRYYSPELCRWISPDSIEYLDPQSINGLNLYCYCMNNPIMYADPSGHLTVAALLISIGISLAFEVLEDAIDGNGWDHDWKDYLGAGISGLFGGLGGTIVHQIGFALAGGMIDAWLSGDLEQNGLFNTLGSIALSSTISLGIGTVAKRVASGFKASSLRKLSKNIANKKLNAIGLNFKIGSNAAKARGGVSFMIRNQSKWIGNIISEYTGSALSSGIVSLGYEQISSYFGWYF